MSTCYVGQVHYGKNTSFSMEISFEGKKIFSDIPQ